MWCLIRTEGYSGLIRVSIILHTPDRSTRAGQLDHAAGILATDRLDIGVAYDIEVPANDYLSGSIRPTVLAGESYCITVLRSSDGKTGSSPADRKGMGCDLAEKLRLPGQRYFCLCGGVETASGTPQDLFGIGQAEGLIIQIPIAGRLYFFANDWPDKYGNNHGSVRLSIIRLS